MDHFVRAAAKMLLAIFAAGIVSSAVLAMASAAVFPNILGGAPSNLAAMTFWVLLPSWAAFVLVHNYKVRNLTPREVAVAEVDNCPRWLLLTSRGLMALGVLLFFFPMFAIALGLGHVSASETEFPSTAMGGFGLIVNTLFFRKLYVLRD